ncbi:BON domain-containing protein [Ectopseudomonas guguanensis]|jgi:osmotically-inducible protein OsmY|uniref:BON domain-containing protein n=1 Tax=Ectopseudomonas guguanensis TaxID=1198456 RepID=UPI0012D5934C|nr:MULTISPECIES: BON domain-containing protein [Pseudomonas]MDR8013462.1 BON domain-containing protein [Pseudomonas guguanensis]MPT20178.1 BON domain-containing protein [Pseudomonas sp.]WJH54754.1 BON domain-containing protein [Pseudomonas guguanensis]
MPPFKPLMLAASTALLLGLTPLASQATEGALAAQLDAARQEGSIWTAFALNRHLNPFKLEIGVEDGVATLGGKVENEVQKELAEQVALSIEGIDSVDNRIEVGGDAVEGNPPAMVQRLEDASLAATVKSKLLWNSTTRGLDIQVRSETGNVTLSGNAQTPAAKELAGQLAANTDGVREVFNHLSISTADSTSSEVQATLDDAREDISDSWITSKVEASFLFSRNLDAMNISVDTADGLVSLRGSVLSSAEKRLAVEIARNIRGVRGVDADALRISS